MIGMAMRQRDHRWAVILELPDDADSMPPRGGVDQKYIKELIELISGAEAV